MTFEEWYRQHFGDATVVQPKKLAEVLGVSRETIYRNLRSADLESFKIGPRSYVIPEPACRKFSRLSMSNNEQQSQKVRES